jgi:hypothetical protein
MKEIVNKIKSRHPIRKFEQSDKLDFTKEEIRND